MKEAIFDNRIYVEYPDGFEEMSAAELGKYFKGDMQRWGARNAQKHTILSVAKTRESVLNLITDAKSVLAGAKHALKKNLKNYRCHEHFDAVLLGKAAKGLRFEYTAEDKNVTQYCELIVVKNKRCFYMSCCLVPLTGQSENSALFSSFNNSLRLL